MDVKENVDKVKEYFKEVYLETKRVTFPSRKETMKGTYVVLITVLSRPSSLASSIWACQNHSGPVPWITDGKMDSDGKEMVCGAYVFGL